MLTPSSKSADPAREFCKLTAIIRVISNAERITTRTGLPAVRRWACRHQGAGRPAWTFGLLACANPALMESLAAIETGDLVKVHGNLRYYETGTERGHELLLESLSAVETVTVALPGSTTISDALDPPPEWSPADGAPPER